MTRQRAVSALMVLVLVVGGGLWWWRAHRTGVHFTAMFTASVGIYTGSEVRILGVPVGAVDSVTPQGTQVRIAMHLDPGVSATSDTAAVIVSPNLVSDRYVQLSGVWTHGPKLQGGAKIPVARTRTPVELDQLYNSLVGLTTALGPKGANSNGALSRVLNVGAANLGGNGKALNATITHLSAASNTLAGSRQGIFGTVDNLSRFSRMLKTNNNSLVTVNNDLASVTGTLADDRRSFAAAMRSLAGALLLVQRFVRTNRSALSANVGKLNKVARTLADERTSLAQALEAAPGLVHGFINAYDPKHNLLRGRVNLNELTLWARHTLAGQTDSAVPLAGSAVSGTSGPTSSAAASTTAASTGPPSLLPSSNVTVCATCGGGR